MSEEIKERARAATARILGTLPGCTTCVEAAGIIARLTRERDEAVDRATVLDFDREHARLRAIALDEICTALFGPGEYTVDEVRAAVPALVARTTAAEARVRELEERLVALEAQLTTRGACQCGDDEVCALARRAQEAERELDRVRVDLVTAQHAIGEGWFAGGADTATAIERKTKALEDGARDARARAAAAEERAQEAEVRAAALESKIAERDAAIEAAARQAAALTEGLRLVSDALDRLDQIYRADAELGDPPVETPAWLQEAQHRAAALLTPTAPTAGAGKRKLCGRPIDDEHGNPTDQPCGFTRPCIYHDAPASKQAGEGERDA